MIWTLLFVIGLTAVRAQAPNFNDASWYCSTLFTEDCGHHQHHPKCGTNGVTYDNMCYIGKAHCADSTVDQRHDGPCGRSESNGTTSTLSPEAIKQGIEILKDLQCTILSSRPCTHHINEKVCATDNITYADFCEYEKARCTHRDLDVLKLGDCGQ